MIKTIIFICSFLFMSVVKADEMAYENWEGLYFPKYKYEENLIKIPNFNHFFGGGTNYILISKWKGKLILQSRVASSRPLRFGYFDSEIREPSKSEQILVEGGCKVKIKFDEHKLLVNMFSILDCNTPLNISGEYIKYFPK